MLVADRCCYGNSFFFPPKFLGILHTKYGVLIIFLHVHLYDIEPDFDLMGTKQGKAFFSPFLPVSPSS